MKWAHGETVHFCAYAGKTADLLIYSTYLDTYKGTKSYNRESVVCLFVQIQIQLCI